MSANTKRTGAVSRRRREAVPACLLLFLLELLAVEFFQRNRIHASAPKILFVVLTGAGWEEIGLQGSDTWQKHVVHPHRLRIASNVYHDTMPESLLLFQHGVDTHKDSQRRFLDVLLNATLGPSEYLFLVDDDTFVIVPNVERFIMEQAFSPQDPIIFGQFSCSDLCGGGGALFSRKALENLRASRDAVMLEFSNDDSPFEWDVVLSRVISTRRVPNLQIVDRAGNFNSQPPNFYANPKHAYVENSVQASRLRDLPLTFHYVDQVHQTKYNETYECGECTSLIPSLYQSFYLPG